MSLDRGLLTGTQATFVRARKTQSSRGKTCAEKEIEVIQNSHGFSGL